MTEITLELDQKASDCLNDLMLHYGMQNKAQVISKAIAVLTLAAHVDRTQGELFARKGNHETKIIVS